MFDVCSVDEQKQIIDDIFPLKVICVPILLCVSILWISVTTVWDITHSLCRCKGHTDYTEVLDSNVNGLMIDLGDIVLPLSGKGQCAILISYNMYYPNLTQWCHMSHRRSSQGETRTCMDDHHPVAFILTSNCITQCSDPVYIFKISIIAYGRLWILRRRNWTRKCKDVGLY
jgi:hypothetical protein